jgi:cytochrome P450
LSAIALSVTLIADPEGGAIYRETEHTMAEASDVRQELLQGYDADTFESLKTADHQTILRDYAAECPVRRTASGDYFAVRMDPVRKVAQDDGSRSLAVVVEESRLGNIRPLIPLQIDGDEHREYRRILDPLFSPRRMAALEPAVRELADHLIDSFIENGTADLYNEFCAILPATVFVRLMGIPEGDIAYFMSFKNDLLRSDPAEPQEQALERFAAAGKRCYDYFGGLLAEREASSETHDDLVAWFMSAEVDGRRLTHENILDITYLLMIAGLDTVAASLSCFLSWLARNPVQRREIVANPEMWPRVVEELLRFETPVPNTVRYASEDIDMDGMKIPKGSRVYMSWAAANLDPAAFPNPLTVDFERGRNPHVTFASGAHRCLWSHLARLELITALDQFHRRIPDYDIQPGHVLQYEALPVRLVDPLPLVWSDTHTS